MAVKFYSHEFKLFIVGILSFFAIHYSSILHITLQISTLPLIFNRILNLLLNLTIYSVVISLITYKMFMGNEPGKYYIIWFWSIFINYYFFHQFPFNFGIFTGFVLAMLFAIPPALTMSAIRYKRRAVNSLLPTGQLWLGSIMFASLILLSIYTGIKITLFLYLAFVGLLLSFLALGTYKILVNLSLIPMFIIAIEYTGNTIFEVTLPTILLVFGVSFLVFWLSLKPAIEMNNGEFTPIGVVSSKYFSLVFPVIITVVWYFSHLFFKNISPLTLSDFSLIFLPTVIFNTVADYLRGIQLNKITKQNTGQDISIIIGGVGLADGLWLDLVGVMIYYLVVMRFGFFEGSLFYSIFIIPAIVLLTRFA